MLACHHDDRSRKSRRRGGLVVGSLTLVGALLLAPAALATESFQSIKLDGAERAEVKIDVDAGRVEITADDPPAADVAPNLVSAVYDVTGSGWAPKADYSVTDGVGSLTLRQDTLTGLDLTEAEDAAGGNFDVTWDLAFNPTVPSRLEVDIDAGEAEIIAAGLTLEDLDVEVEAGQIELDLRGVWTTAPGPIKLKTSGGRIVIKVPSGVGVRIDASTSFAGRVVTGDGLAKLDGDWINLSYGQTAITINVEADATVGEITLETDL